MQTKLNTDDRRAVNELCTIMMEMNNRDDANADQRSTYGHIYRAIIAFVLNQTGVDITNAPVRYGWNLGAHRTYAEDIQATIDSVVDTAAKAADDSSESEDSATIDK